MNDQAPAHRPIGPANLRRASAVATVALLVPGCTSIWNAGDLANWVRDQAVERGCQRETIELEDWYAETAEGNVWRGTCRDAQGGAMPFGINVDPVWTPSQSTT